MAQNLFYEDLNTGLESFTPVITKIDLALFENVGSVLASFIEFQLVLRRNKKADLSGPRLQGFRYC